MQTQVRGPISVSGAWPYADTELVAKTAAFQRGEEEGFTFFFKSLYPALLYYAFNILKNKLLAEEATGEVFIRIWEVHEKFSHSGEIRDNLYAQTRVISIALLSDERKSEIENQKAITITNQIISAEVISQVHATMSSLPDEFRKIFEMVHIQGKTLKETAIELYGTDDVANGILVVKSMKDEGLKILKGKFPDIFSGV